MLAFRARDDSTVFVEARGIVYVVGSSRGRIMEGQVRQRQR